MAQAIMQKTERRAYTVVEFSRMAGKSRDWGYRMIEKGKVKTIEGYGPKLIPASEVDRIFGKPTEGAAEPAVL